MGIICTFTVRWLTLSITFRSFFDGTPLALAAPLPLILLWLSHPMIRSLLAAVALFALAPAAFADDPAPAPAPPPPAWKADVDAAGNSATGSADTAWVLVSTALVMFMLPGLALFYGGMVRRKNILGTMMHTMMALGLVGVQWVGCGYSLAFGESKGGYIGFSPELLGLGSAAAIGTADTPDDALKAKNIDPATATDEQKKAAEDEIKSKNRFQVFPGTKVPLYLHAMFQGMFAIITVALVSGAFAERVKFSAYCLFALLWTTLVYDPLAHWVWAFDWGTGKASGWLGAKGALDFAGGTVVHIAAGVSGLVTVLLLRKRSGYGKHPFHPSSMVLTLLGAGMLWFGWFGFNGGSALASNKLAVSALTVTQIAAAAAGVAWVLVEWLHRGKPTALGFASGLVAGLVAITPASGFVEPGGALAIGGLAGVVCYWAVAVKTKLGYDDSLDAFGIHGVGGMLGAVLTGVFCAVPLWMYGTGTTDEKAFVGVIENDHFSRGGQVMVQLMAVAAAAAFSAIVTAILVLVIDKTIGFTLTKKDEATGLDLSQHGEVGLDVGPDVEEATLTVPKAAAKPPAQYNGGSGRFSVVLDGSDPKQVQAAWADLCKPTAAAPRPEFVAVYKHLTTIAGNRFNFRGGDPAEMRKSLAALFAGATPRAV